MSDDRGEIVFEDNILDAGFVQIPALVIFDGALSPGAKTTYAALLWYGWKFREFPGQTIIAQDIGATDRTVRRHLTELEENGYIRVEQLGLGRTNKYVIRSLRDRPVPDRTKMSGLGGHNRPVRPDKNVRSLQLVDVKDETLEQQQQATPDREPEKAPVKSQSKAVVVAHDESLTADDLTARLTALGVTRTTARKLLKEHDLALVYRWVCYTEHKLQTGWVPKETPAAWLVSALRSEDWVIPNWFQTPEEQDAAQADSHQVAAKERRRREQEEAREREEAEGQRRSMEQALGVGERERDAWARALELLQQRGQMTPALFSAYLLPLEKETATIATSVEFFCKVIPKHAEAIRAALEEATGETVKGVDVRWMQSE